MKIIIPVAGIGSRLKPHTFTTPKPLMEVAGKPIIDYVLDDVKKLNPSEVVFVVGYKKQAVKEYVLEKYPQLNSSFVYQKVRDGDGSAVRLALETINEDDDFYVIYGADTLVDFNVKKAITTNKGTDALIFAMKVPNPSSYGVVNYDENYNITQVEEKPQKPKSDLAIIGAYYFKSTFTIRNHLRHFYDNKITEKDEFRLIQAIRQLVEDENKIVKVYPVDEWFDCGRIEVLLNANKYFLSKKSNGSKISIRDTSIVIPPVYIHKDAVIKNSVIGPNVSIGKGAKLENVNISNSIINPNSDIKNVILSNSLIGKEVIYKDKMKQLNIGDKSELILE